MVIQFVKMLFILITTFDAAVGWSDSNGSGAASPTEDTTQRLTKSQMARQYAPDPNLPADEFTQQFYKVMRNGAPGKETPMQAVERALRETSVSDLKKLQDAAVQREIGRYNQARKRLEVLSKSENPRDIARADKLQKVLQKDPVALGNGPHVQEILDNVDKHQQSMRNIFEDLLGRKMNDAEFSHAFQYMKTTVAVHDLGKTSPSEVVLEAAKSTGKDAFLKGRIAMHELSSATEIQFLAKKNHIGPKTADYLVRDILGHNEGSGLTDVWWNEFGHKGLGVYPKPDSPVSSLMALVDRGGQGTLGKNGGVYKITSLQIAKGEKWGKDLLENETMKKNAMNTNRQMDAIANDFESNYGVSIKDTPMVQSLMAENQKTIDAFNSVHWNADNTSGTVAGQPFTNKDEFFKIINDTETKVQSGELSPNYWSQQTFHVSPGGSTPSHLSTESEGTGSSNTITSNAAPKAKTQVATKGPAVANADNVKITEVKPNELTPEAKKLAIQASERAGLISEAESSANSDLKFVKILIPGAKGGLIAVIVAIPFAAWQAYEVCRVEIIKKGSCSLKTVGKSALKSFGEALLGYLTYEGLAVVAGTVVAATLTTIPLDAVVFEQFLSYTYSSVYSGINKLCQSKDPSLNGSWITNQCQQLSPLQQTMLQRRRAQVVVACKEQGYSGCEYYYTHNTDSQSIPTPASSSTTAH